MNCAVKKYLNCKSEDGRKFIDCAIIEAVHKNWLKSTYRLCDAAIPIMAPYDREGVAKKITTVALQRARTLEPQMRRFQVAATHLDEAIVEEWIRILEKRALRDESNDKAQSDMRQCFEVITCSYLQHTIHQNPRHISDFPSRRLVQGARTTPTTVQGPV